MNQKVPSGIEAEAEAECNVSCRGRSARRNAIEGNCLGKNIVLTRTHSVDLGVGLGQGTDVGVLVVHGCVCIRLTGWFCAFAVADGVP